MSVNDPTPRRRLHIRVERESMVEIDEEKLAKSYGEFATVAKLERALKTPMNGGERFGSIDDLATRVGVVGRYDRDHEVSIDIEVEEECVKHGVWYGTNPGSLAYCWKCKNEQRERGKKR